MIMSSPHTVEAASEASEDLEAEGYLQTRSFSMVTQRIAFLLNASSAANSINTANSIASSAQAGKTVFTSLKDVQPLTDYDDSDFRQHWMPDSKCKDCYECHEKFTAFRRRHHCRICGQIFCSKCCKNEISGRFFGYSGNLRLCNYCSKQVSVHMKKLSIANSSLPNNNENEENRVDFENSFFSRSASDYDPISAKNSSPMETTNESESKSLVPGGNISMSSDYSNIFDEVEPDWVKNIRQDESDGVRKFQDVGTTSSNDNVTSTESNVDMTGRSTVTQNNRDDDASYVKEFAEPVRKISMVLTPVNDQELSVSSENENSSAYKPSTDFLLQSFEEKAQHFIKFLLKKGNLKEEWLQVLWPLSREIAFTVQPNVKLRGDDIDILKYVHVKTCPFKDSMPSTRVVFGTACTKAIVDARMKQKFSYPRILLIAGSIEYERFEGRFCSIDPILSQELEYLRSIVLKIASRKPDIVIVENTVARIAKAIMRESGISLICNVKQQVLYRIARCTQAEIVRSIEGQIFQAKLGFCGSLRTELVPCDHISVGLLDNYLSENSSKSYLLIEDCPPDLGCSIILNGPDKHDLRKVKHIFKGCLRLLYSAKLEIAILRLMRIEKILSDRNCDGMCKHSNCEICQDYCRDSIMNFRKIYANFSESEYGNSPDISQEMIFFISPFIRVRPTEFCYSIGGPADAFIEESKINSNNDEQESPSAADANGGLVTTEDALVESLMMTHSANHSTIPSSHPFLSKTITKGVSSYEMRKELANYRASGGKIFEKRLASMRSNKILSTNVLGKGPKIRNRISNSSISLDPWRHQRLTVLYCSYLFKPNSATKVLGFCLKPRVFVMHFYNSRFDCTLGDYLERYCFDQSYSCSHEACGLNMLNHVRKLIHGNCCIEITVQIVSVSDDGADQSSTMSNDQITVWDWCPDCKSITSAQVLNRESWHLSFAKYLSYIFNGDFVESRLVDDTPCKCCSLHTHVHHFAIKNLVATFRSYRIALHDLSLPNKFEYFDDIGSQNDNLSSWNETYLYRMKKDEEKLTRILDNAAENFASLKTLMSSSDFIINLTKLQAAVSFGNLLSILQVLVDKVSRIVMLYDETGLKNSVDTFEICMQKTLIEKARLAEIVIKWNEALNDALIGLKKKKDAEESKAVLPVVENQVSVVEGGGQSSETASLSDFASPHVRQTLNSSSTNEISATSSPSNVPCDRKSLSKLLSSYILSSPFESCEHYMPNSFANKLHILVNEKECGSIVAFSLNSDQYEVQRRLLVARWLENGPLFPMKHPAFALQSQEEIPEAASIRNPPSLLSDAPPDSSSPHIEIQFNDQTTKFYCKIYFAEHFRLLRRLIFGSDDTSASRSLEQKFITSLSRSENWTPKGGKSGAIFNRSADKRFVLKQISRFELQSFQKFAPDYFDYVADAWTSKRPTALAKVFGLYRVCLTNSQTSTDVKMDFIVMEYLFYGKNVDKVYDLKGSVRNRLAPLTPNVLVQNNVKNESQATNSANSCSRNADDAVLLDVNLLKDVANTSFYLFPKAKSVLNQALSNDTHFLAKNHVMDYSLLCAFDKDNQDRLIVGIIDYMRTYTWDKRLESWVKSTVTINNQLPTVVSPELYRERFVAIMDVYFPVAPDQWTGL